MKPGRLQNALKSLGRTSKCVKILQPGSKTLGPDSRFLENVGSGLPKIAKLTKIQKMWFFRSPNREKFDHWDGKIGSQLPLKKKETILFSSFLVRLAFLNPTCFGSGGAILFRQTRNRNIKNTWKSKKTRKSIKINGNKQK